MLAIDQIAAGSRSVATRAQQIATAASRQRELAADLAVCSNVVVASSSAAADKLAADSESNDEAAQHEGLQA